MGLNNMLVADRPLTVVLAKDVRDALPTAANPFAAVHLQQLAQLQLAQVQQMQLAQQVAALRAMAKINPQSVIAPGSAPLLLHLVVPTRHWSGWT